MTGITIIEHLPYNIKYTSSALYLGNALTTKQPESVGGGTWKRKDITLNPKSSGFILLTGTAIQTGNGEGRGNSACIAIGEKIIECTPIIPFERDAYLLIKKTVKTATVNV